jgi:hypothetical protein
VPENVQITLRYQGPNVNDGTMSVGDVVVALQGFSGAYGKISTRLDPHGQHEIRISELNKSSFAVVVTAWVHDNKELIIASSSAATAVVGLIIKLLEFKKKNKGKEPANVQVTGDGNIVLMGEGNSSVTIPKDLYELYKAKSLDVEFAKIIRPLEEDKIDKAELIARDSFTKQEERTELLFSDKPYFQVEDSVTITSKPAQLVGHMVSLNKDSNRGMFRMQNGKSVKYHLVGEDPTAMYHGFAHRGAVKIECVASFDEDLEVKSIEIASVLPLQAMFDFDSADTTQEDPAKR